MLWLEENFCILTEKTTPISFSHGRIITHRNLSYNLLQAYGFVLVVKNKAESLHYFWKTSNHASYL